MKVRKSQSLQVRTLIYNVSIVGAALGFLTGLFLFQQHSAMDQQLLLRADALAGFLASQTQFAMLVGDRAELGTLVSSTLRNEDVLHVRFSSADGVTIAERSGTRVSPSELARSLKIIRPVLAPSDGVSDLDSGVRRIGSLGAVEIDFSKQKHQALFAQTVRYALGVAILSLAMILAGQFVQFRRLMAPLRDLIEFTGKVGKGELSQAATVTRMDEIGHLTAAFNEMVARLRISRGEMASLLQQAQEASRLKSEFLANISHEIRTPMNGIIGMTGLVLASSLDSEQQDSLRMVKQSADSLLVIINDILDFSKIEAGKMDLDPIDFNLRDLIDDIAGSLQVMAWQKQLRLTYAFDPAVPCWVRGDPVRLRQILVNLLGNALKFTERGSVHVSVAADNAELAARPLLFRFSVRDTGIGIPPEQQSNIFQAFRQADGSTSRKYGGTGLGLAICARLTDLMGGRIWVESRPGLGSDFQFTAMLGLPAQNGTPAVRVQPAPSSPRKLNILLAEDNVVNQKLALRLLQRAGHSVVCVNDGRQAVETFTHDRFDLVLMDVQMPDMDGFEATAAIRRLDASLGRHTPILALTANALKGDRERCLAAGMDGYVAKPLNPEQLFTTITRLCAAGRVDQAEAN